MQKGQLLFLCMLSLFVVKNILYAQQETTSVQIQPAPSVEAGDDEQPIKQKVAQEQIQQKIVKETTATTPTQFEQVPQAVQKATVTTTQQPGIPQPVQTTEKQQTVPIQPITQPTVPGAAEVPVAQVPTQPTQQAEQDTLAPVAQPQAAQVPAAVQPQPADAGQQQQKEQAPAKQLSELSEIQQQPVTTQEIPVQTQKELVLPTQPVTEAQEIPQEQLPVQQSIEPTTPELLPSEQIEEPTGIEEIDPVEEQLGIDTIDLEEPQGNWLFKRIWWERAQERYERIRMLVNTLSDFRMNFFAKRTDIDKNILDPFYIDAGFGRGEFQEIIKQLLDRLEKIRSQEGVLSEQERAFVTDLENEQRVLEDLQNGIEIVTKLDHDVDESILKLIDHINGMRAYEQESWQAFKDIARVLSDKKARELFYHIENAWRNVKDLNNYLQQDFSQYFDQLTSRLQEEVDRVGKILIGLREKGIVFKEQAQRLEELEREPVQVPEEEIEEEEKVVKPQGWLSWTTNLLVNTTTALWDAITYPFTAVYHVLFGSQKPKPSIDEENEREQIEQAEKVKIQKTEMETKQAATEDDNG